MHHRSITIKLHSQFDIGTLPEYYPDPKDDYTARGITGFTSELFDDKTSTCSVFVPVVPGGTFWISYLVSPPVPDEQYFLFKLYIDGLQIMNWSTGKAEGWRGKTMFGLFESPEDEQGRKRIEKRMLCFAPPERQDSCGRGIADTFDETACIEIRVHRADGRKRIQRQIEEYSNTQHAKKIRGINLIHGGRAGSEQPKRFYKFALIDPVDQPFATFRYYYRTWNQLRDLGVLRPDHSGAGEEDGLSVIEPLDDSVRSTSADQETGNAVSHGQQGRIPDGKGDSNEGPRPGPRSKREQATATFSLTRRPSVKTRKPSYVGPRMRQAGKTGQLRSYVPVGAPSSKTEPSDKESQEEASQRHSDTLKPPQSYRLSIPPSIALEPSGLITRPLPTPPQKSSFPSSSSTAYCPPPANHVDDRAKYTPSPVKPITQRASTPPPGKREEQGRSASSLMGIIASAWKHRGIQKPDGATCADGCDAARRSQ